MTDSNELAGMAAALPADNLQAVINAALASAEPKEVHASGEAYVVVAPAGATIETVRFMPDPDYDQFPSRPRVTYRPATADAFVGICKRHLDADRSTVWAHPTRGRFVAVFDDNQAPDAPLEHSDQPASHWREHRAVLELTHTPEWLHWTSKDGQLRDQVAFAEHIEDGLTEIASPPGADLLEMAQTFHAHTTAAFRSAQRLQSGQVQVRYDEEIEAKTGRGGDVEIPALFSIVVRPFLGSEPVLMDARLRYRLGGGKLTLGYKLDHPDLAVRKVIDRIRTEIEAELGEHLQGSIFVGEPD